MRARAGTAVELFADGGDLLTDLGDILLVLAGGLKSASVKWRSMPMSAVTTGHCGHSRWNCSQNQFPLVGSSLSSAQQVPADADHHAEREVRCGKRPDQATRSEICTIRCDAARSRLLNALFVFPVAFPRVPPEKRGERCSYARLYHAVDIGTVEVAKGHSEHQLRVESSETVKSACRRRKTRSVRLLRSGRWVKR